MGATCSFNKRLEHPLELVIRLWCSYLACYLIFRMVGGVMYMKQGTPVTRLGKYSFNLYLMLTSIKTYNLYDIGMLSKKLPNPKYVLRKLLQI
jgi:hypothetical protein